MASIYPSGQFIRVELLADHPHLISQVGEIRWREWGRAPEPEQLEWWVDITGREAGRDALPVTWVAINDAGRAVGAVGLGKFDIAERRDRSPWVLGMITTAKLRGRGIGSMLATTLLKWAARHGHSRVWVAAGGRAIDFYAKHGWSVTETITRSTGEVVAILAKDIQI